LRDFTNRNAKALAPAAKTFIRSWTPRCRISVRRHLKLRQKVALERFEAVAAIQAEDGWQRWKQITYGKCSCGLHPVDQMTVAMLAHDTAFVLLLASGDANG
jgi:hypothetical protein